MTSMNINFKQIYLGLLMYFKTKYQVNDFI